MYTLLSRGRGPSSRGTLPTVVQHSGLGWSTVSLDHSMYPPLWAHHPPPTENPGLTMSTNMLILWKTSRSLRIFAALRRSAIRRVSVQHSRSTDVFQTETNLTSGCLCIRNTGRDEDRTEKDSSRGRGTHDAHEARMRRFAFDACTQQRLTPTHIKTSVPTAVAPTQQPRWALCVPGIVSTTTPRLSYAAA